MIDNLSITLALIILLIASTVAKAIIISLPYIWLISMIVFGLSSDMVGVLFINAVMIILTWGGSKVDESFNVEPSETDTDLIDIFYDTQTHR